MGQDAYILTVSMHFKDQSPNSRNEPIDPFGFELLLRAVIIEGFRNREDLEDATYRHEETILTHISSRADASFEVSGSADRNLLELEEDSGAYRRPKPNARSCGSRISGLIAPSFMNLSGLNFSGSGYSRGSLSMCLWRVQLNDSDIN